MNRFKMGESKLIVNMFLVMCRQLIFAKERCEGEPEGDGVSALTSDERTRWAKVRLLVVKETIT